MRCATLQTIPCRTRAFTLVEILIVMLVLGILAAIVVPTLNVSTDGARRTTFYSNVRIFGNAAELYFHNEGVYLEDASTGEVPAGFESYIDTSAWTGATPIGGRWDSEREDNGITAGIGVHFIDGDAPDDAFMALADAVGDDGDLDSGVFQKLGDGRFYWVQAE